MENDRRKLKWLYLTIYLSKTATLYNWILKIETETKFATLLLKRKEKLNSLSIGNWTSSRMNIQIFLWVSNGREPNSNSTNTSYSKGSQKGFKNSSKMQLLFWTTFLGLECFYGHSNSKMSNQKTKHILILLLRISDCKDKDKKWNSWILLHHL